MGTARVAPLPTVRFSTKSVMFFQNNDRCGGRALPHRTQHSSSCPGSRRDEMHLVCELISRYFTSVFQKSKPSPSDIQGLPNVGNHEGRTIPKKRYNISLPYTLSATCI